jgi:CheY-like chemotaxis protein
MLLDLMMPELDGFQVIAEMKAKQEWQNIPIVVLTAKDLTNEERQILSGHVEQIIEKESYSGDELIQEIRNMIVSHIQQQPDSAKEEDTDG